jgi:hypothetical protein
MTQSEEDLFGVVIDRLTRRTDDLVERQLLALRAFASYDRVPDEDLRRSCRRNVARVVGMLGDSQKLPLSVEEDERASGQRRALQAVPSEDVVLAYRAVLSVLRDAFIEEAAAAAVDARVVLIGTKRLWDLTDRFSSVLVSARHQVDLESARRDERQRIELLQNLLMGTINPQELVHGGAVHGMLPAGEFWVFRARHITGVSQQLSRHIERTAATSQFPPLLGPVDGDLAGISVNLPATADFAVIAVAGPAPLAAVQQAFAEATRVLDVAMRYGRIGLVDSTSLSVRMAVAQEQGLGATLHKRYVGAVHHASKMSDALLESVQVYLREHRNMSAAAQALSVHVNTLRYRLDKYESITGARLEELEDLVEVWWALEYERIMERRPDSDDAE